MATNRRGKLQNFVNNRMRAIMNDGRQFSGQMLAFDKHMNLVLADTEEFRRVKRRSPPGSTSSPTPPNDNNSTSNNNSQQDSLNPSTSSSQFVSVEEKRTLGLCIIRGTNVVSMTVEGPPPADPASRLGVGPFGVGGPGVGLGVPLSSTAGPGSSAAPTPPSNPISATTIGYPTSHQLFLGGTGPGPGAVAAAAPATSTIPLGPGLSRPAGRGIPVGLAGPAPLAGPPGTHMIPGSYGHAAGPVPPPLAPPPGANFPPQPGGPAGVTGTGPSPPYTTTHHPGLK